MFIVHLNFLEDNIYKTSGFKEETYLYAKRSLSALPTLVRKQQQPEEKPTHQLRYKHVLAYFVATQKRILLDKYLIGIFF